MLMTLHVKYVDGSAADATVTAADFIRFEETWNRSIAQFQSDFRFTDLCWLAWHSLTRTKRTAEQWDEWINRLDEVSAADEDTAALAPLESNQPTG